MSEADMAAIAARTSHVHPGLPAEGEGGKGGDPGPHTSRGIFLGVKEAVRVGIGKDSLWASMSRCRARGKSVGSGLAWHSRREGARLTLADIDAARAAKLAAELGGEAVPADAIMDIECDVFSPCALGAILDDEGIARLRAPVVAGGANNQLARAEHGDILAQRGILYAPDYVINAGGIIAVTDEYLARREGAKLDLAKTHAAVDAIPVVSDKNPEIARAEATPPSRVADAMAQRLIGRA